MNATTIGARRERFRALHQAGTFVIPNPWDAGTAKILASLGFPALATTSAGMAWTEGRPDSGVSRADVLAHVARIVGAVDLPVNADYEAGFADDPGPLAESVAACAATGVAGLSIEDNTQRREAPLYPFDLAVRRIEAAAKTLKGTGVLLTARCEAHLVGWPDADAEILRRLAAFAEAGADVLYAPGLRTKAQIEAVIAAVSPKPVNILVGGAIGLSVADLAAMGARRISVGSAFARAAIGGLMEIAREVAGPGTFTSLAKAPPYAEIDGLFRTGGRT